MIVIKVLMVIILIFTNFLSINLIISLLEDSKKQNEEIERLNNDLGDMVKLFAKEREQTKRLKTELEIEQDISEGMLEAIDKAIEYIDYYLKNGHTKDWKQLEYSLLEILKKENK